MFTFSSNIKSKFAVAAVVAAGTMAVPAIAAATTVSPAGPISATATNGTSFSASGVSIGCTNSAITGSVASSGLGSIPTSASNPSFTGCSVTGAGIPVTVTANATPTSWGINLSYVGSSAPEGSLNISTISAHLDVGPGLCSFDATGSVTGDYYNDLGNGVSGVRLLSATGLTVANSTGSPCPANGAAGTFDADPYEVTDGSGGNVTVAP